MAHRRWLICSLAGVNLALLLALLSSVDWLPRSWAQAAGGGGRPGDFISVTAKAQGQSYDTLFVVDIPNRKLHAFSPSNAKPVGLGYGGSRDLKSDFGR